MLELNLLVVELLEHVTLPSLFPQFFQLIHRQLVTGELRTQLRAFRVLRLLLKMKKSFLYLFHTLLQEVVDVRFV